MVYYTNQDGDDDNNDDYDWSSGSTTANAVCVALNSYEVAKKEEYEDGKEEEEDKEDRKLSSNSQDNYSFGGSLGYNLDGTYVIATFQSSLCDRDFFTGIVDDLKNVMTNTTRLGGSLSMRMVTS